MNDDELKRFIGERMVLVQSGLDSTKSTFLTAGVLVAVSLKIPGLEHNFVFGQTGTTIILSLAITSAIFHVLSFVVAENQVKRHDKLVGLEIKVTPLEKFITRGNVNFQAKWIPRFYGNFHNWLINCFNGISSALLLLALLSFLLCLF